ncbi:MAG: YdiU family protein, partial [Oscillospiraceae bacterium]|nr:YdiU family protein [Oscillospiraceae bacterium]
APAPQMVLFNQELAETLGLNSNLLQTASGLFSGTLLPDGARPIAQAYAGYQFGHFSVLGDGRAVLLGEHITSDGHRFDIQLKGSGRTPYSRRGDGLAALSPMLREYIISEAMFHLGIPTTRSLAVTLTGQDVIRETVLPGAVLTRVASSHIRVGTFNYVSVLGSKEDLIRLADYSIWRHFPWLAHEANKYLLFLREVARLQASLIAKWQAVGFIHGVMNTDNMAISGETIDYGPCAFMDVYDPETVFSSIDTSGRYAYKNQPIIGAWNLSRFAESLLPLLHENSDRAINLANQEMERYWQCYDENWLVGMRAKLGMITGQPEDIELIGELLSLMHTHKLDYTATFRALSDIHQNTSPLFDILEWITWRKKWMDRLENQPEGLDYAFEIMRQHNPSVIPRNHRVEEALAAAEQGDLTVLENLLHALRNPYEDSDVYSIVPEASSCGYRTFCGT